MSQPSQDFGHESLARNDQQLKTNRSIGPSASSVLPIGRKLQRLATRKDGWLSGEIRRTASRISVWLRKYVHNNIIERSAMPQPRQGGNTPKDRFACQLARIGRSRWASADPTSAPVPTWNTPNARRDPPVLHCRSESWIYLATDAAVLRPPFSQRAIASSSPAKCAAA